VSITSRSVFADHLDVGSFYTRARDRFEEAIICAAFIIQSTAAVTFLNKLNLPGLGVVWLIGGLLCLLVAAMNPLATLKGAIVGWPFFLISVWASLSLGWTIDSYETLRAILLLWAGQIFVFAVAGKYSWDRIITLLAICLCGLVAFSLIVVVAMPSVGRMQDIHLGAWSGAWAEKQGMGIYASHGLMAALTMVWRGQAYRWWWLGVLICAIGIIGTTSKTALIMTFLALAVGFWFRIFYRGLLGKVIGGWLAALGAILIIPIATGSVDGLLKAMGKSSDLTGRADIWSAVQKVADMRPDHGWGYQAIFRGKDDMTSPYQWINEWTDFLPANAHSSWLDVYVQLGHIGVALLIACVIWAWIGLFVTREKSNRSIAFIAATLAPITFISFTETNLLVGMELQWILFTLLACKLFMPGDEQAATDSGQDGTLAGDTFTYSQ
jgi:exopolysaccharide production protein ExoQ